MTFYSKVGTISTPTSTGNQTVSGIGFTPVVLIIWGTAQSGTGFAAGDSFGLGLSAYNSAKSAYQQGAVSCAGASTIGNRQYVYQAATSFVLFLYDTTLLLNGTITTMSASNGGQFIINWATVYSSPFTLNYLALGGSHITGAGVIHSTQPISAGNKSVAGLGFAPSCVMHLGAYYSGVPPATAINAQIQLGAMTSSDQWAIGDIAIYGANPSNTSRTQLTDHAFVMEASGSASAKRIGMDSDGFTLNWDTVSAYANYLWSLCLAGVTCQVGAWSKATGANGSTDQIATTGITPVAVIAATDSYVASASTQTGFRFSIGASDGTNNCAAGGTSEQGANPSVDYKFAYADEAIVVNDSDTATPDALGSIGFANHAFVVTWGTNNAVATQICYIVFGTPSVVVTLTPPTATTTTYAPTQGVAPTLIAPTSSTTTTTAPSPNVAPVITTPTGTTTTTTPTFAQATTLAAPTATTETDAPVISGVSNIALTAPTATTATFATSQDVVTTLTAPSAATEINPISQDVGSALKKPTATTATFTPTRKVNPVITAPAATTETYSPVISGISSITLTAPTATATTHAAALDISPALVTPTATTAVSAMSQAVIATTLLRVPTATTATRTIFIPHRKNIKVIKAICGQLEIAPLRGISRNTDMLTAVREKY